MTLTRVVRWLPFLGLAMFSLWFAAQAPDGRKPFSLSLDVTLTSLAHVAVKPIHFRATAVLFLLGIVAVGARRLPWALGLTLLVSFGWEVAQATVLGHNARLADMLPNIIAAVTTAGLFLGCRPLLSSVRRHNRRLEERPSPDGGQFSASS